MFSLNNQVLEEARDYIFVIDGQTINYNSTQKILGITLDEKLKFEKHIENVERKAIQSLDQGCAVETTPGFNQLVKTALVNKPKSGQYWSKQIWVVDWKF